MMIPATETYWQKVLQPPEHERAMLFPALGRRLGRVVRLPLDTPVPLVIGAQRTEQGWVCGYTWADWEYALRSIGRAPAECDRAAWLTEPVKLR